MDERKLNDYVFHFTGRLNQSYVMEDSRGTAVYEAECEKITLFRDTPFCFRDKRTGREERKLVSNTVTNSVGVGEDFRVVASSWFTMDKVPVWDILSGMGLTMSMSLHGIAAHYTIYQHGEEIGWAELAGTGAYNPKYKDSKLGQLPSNGIFRVRCTAEDVPGVFLLCFAITKTDVGRTE